MLDEDAVVMGGNCCLKPIPTGETPTGLSSLSRVKAILFDVYGTLVISSSGDRDSLDLNRDRKRLLIHVLRRYGIHRTPEDLMDSLRRSIQDRHESLRQEGIDYPEVDIVLVWKAILQAQSAAWVADFALAYEMAVNPICPMPGLRELLWACQRRNLPMGIISNAQFYTPLLLERLLGTSLQMSGFDPHLIFFSYRFRVAKPSGFMFEKAIEALARRGIVPASVLYVGNDMRKDILPAKKLGFQTALFAGDRRSLRRRSHDACCRQVVPDVIVTDLRQLIVDSGHP